MKPISSQAGNTWLDVALLVLVALLNYLDRQMLVAMNFCVMNNITEIGREENGGKILALFKWIYAVFSPSGAYIADRTTRRHVIVGNWFARPVVTWRTGRVTTGEPLLAAPAWMGIYGSLSSAIPGHFGCATKVPRQPDLPRSHS